MKFHLGLMTTLIWIVLACESANILYVIPTHGKSHYIAQKDLPLELARRGHEVFVITPFKEKDPPATYHEIYYHVDEEAWFKEFRMSTDQQMSIFTLRKLPFIAIMYMITFLSKFMIESVFDAKEIQNFLQEDHQFDVVFCEVFFNDATYMLAHKYNAPLILVSTYGHSMRAGYNARNPLQLSTLYHEQGSAENPLNFIGRLKNFSFYLCDMALNKFFYLPRQQSLAVKYLKPAEPVPSLDEIAGNAALVLMNNHFTIDTPGAYLPNFVEVGGMSLQATQNLPEDLQTILDNSENGAIYMSFGSAVNMTDLGEEKLIAFLNVFRELKQTVLLKCNEALENVPKNVVIRKWFPQKDIFAHKNIQLFITHGGLIGLTEAVHSGVPVLGLPIMADQPMNLYHAKRLGFGEIINYDDFTEVNLRNVVQKVLNNTKYKENALIVSERFKDRPMGALDTAVWWTEYVIRHKGASFMRTPALQLSFVEYHMWDVYAFFLAVSLLNTFIMVKIVKKLLKKFFTRNKNIAIKKNQ